MARQEGDRMREPGDLRAGFLRLGLDDDDTDYETLYLADGPGKYAFIPGIHVPNDVLQRYGELFVRFITTATDASYRAGERRNLGKGVLIPHQRGIRLRDRENPQRSMLHVTEIRSIMKAQVWVHLTFRTIG